MICRLCGSQQVFESKNVESPHFEVEYTLYECRSCASAFFEIEQHQVDIEKLYDDVATTKADIYEGLFRPSRYWQHETALIRRCAKIPIQSVLDVGCRTGDFLKHWPADIERVGVELSLRSAEVARSRGLIIHQGYLEKTEFDQPFDVVTCYAVIEHLSNPTTFISRLARLVNPGGVLAIMVPTRECLKRRLIDAVGKRWHMYCPPQHLNFISRARLDQSLSSNDFELHRRRFTSGGMFNPLSVIPIADKVGARLMEINDRHGPLNFLPIFDHMYSYYRLEKQPKH